MARPTYITQRPWALSAAFTVASLAVAVATVLMTVVHEDVHQRACQQERKRQDAQHVCAVLGELKEATDGYNDEERHSRA
jgi:tRNA U34 2-thiouridine synthase MnmA/TrmU